MTGDGGGGGVWRKELKGGGEATNNGVHDNIRDTKRVHNRLCNLHFQQILCRSAAEEVTDISISSAWQSVIYYA